MKQEENEEYRWVVGYEGLYMVSNFGNVLSVKRAVTDLHGNHIYSKSDKILSPFTTKEGYLRVILCKDNVTAKYTIHRLVAEVFVPNPDNKPQVNHVDGDKTNNFDWNLEWCTAKENIRHAHDTKLMGGFRTPKELRDAIIAYYVRGSKDRGCVATGKKFGVGKQTVLNIVRQANNIEEVVE